MSEVLTRPDQAPEWALALYAGRDTLECKHAFGCFLPDAELQFGTAQRQGIEAMKEFLIHVDGPSTSSTTCTISGTAECSSCWGVRS